VILRLQKHHKIIIIILRWALGKARGKELNVGKSGLYLLGNENASRTILNGTRINACACGRDVNSSRHIL
jgi:hypothetical protein